MPEVRGPVVSADYPMRINHVYLRLERRCKEAPSKLYQECAAKRASGWRAGVAGLSWMKQTERLERAFEPNSE